jgi:hypothetical protein
LSEQTAGREQGDEAGHAGKVPEVLGSHGW